MVNGLSNSFDHLYKWIVELIRAIIIHGLLRQCDYLSLLYKNRQVLTLKRLNFIIMVLTVIMRLWTQTYNCHLNIKSLIIILNVWPCVFTYGLKNQMPIITCAQIKGQKKNACASVNTLYLYPVYVPPRGPLNCVSSLSAFSIYRRDSRIYDNVIIWGGILFSFTMMLEIVLIQLQSE